jgi:hypothetical protein
MYIDAAAHLFFNFLSNHGITLGMNPWHSLAQLGLHHRLGKKRAKRERQGKKKKHEIVSGRTKE